MTGIFKRTLALSFITILSVLLCGCSEEQRLYSDAKKMMGLSGKARELDEFSAAASKLTKEERIRVSVYCTYPEWAGDVFTSLGEYKDAKALAKESYYLAASYNFEIYTNYQQKKLSNPRRLFLDNSYTLFVKAGDYKDAPALAAECGVIKIKNAFTDAKINGRYGDVALVFQSFDDELKGNIAELFYRQELAPSLAADDWGMDGDKPDLTGPEAKKRQDYINDLFFLNIIKDYKPVPANIREKMYRAAVHRAGSEPFWAKQVKSWHRNYANSTSKEFKLLQEEVFDYLGEYKDSPFWLKRIREYGTTPVINASAFVAQTDGAGNTPQARTVAVTFSTDGKISDAFVTLGIESDIQRKLCEKLKDATKGNIFFTKDTAQACAIIHYAVSHEHYGQFKYSGGGIADYYHTKAVTEIRSADGTLLLSKSAVVKVRKAQSSIGGDFKHLNITMSVPVYDPAQTLKILEKQFSAMENK